MYKILIIILSVFLIDCTFQKESVTNNSQANLDVNTSQANPGINTNNTNSLTMIDSEESPTPDLEQQYREEADNIAENYIKKYFIKCDGSYFFKPNRSLIFQFKGDPQYSMNGKRLMPKELSKADVLNNVDPLPIEWEGRMGIEFEVNRRYVIDEKTWGPWREDHESSWSKGIKRVKGKWEVEPSEPYEIRCSEMPSIE